MQLKMYRGKWAAVWYEGAQVKRRSLGTADRATAEVEFDRFQRGHMGRTATVEEALAAYCTAKGFREPHPTYYAAIKIGASWGKYGLDDISPAICDDYIAQRRREGRKDGTIIKQLGVCRTAINHAKPKNSSVFKFPPPPEPRDLRLTRAEFERLLDSAGSDHIRLYLELAAATGARNGAILDLTWGQIDLEHGLIDFGRGVGNKKRATVPLTASLNAQLASRATRTAPNERVVTFAGREVASVKKAFGRAATKAGLSWATPHVIRHSAACWLAEGGIPMPEIAAYLGHKDSRITERVYAKYSPTYLRRAAAVLERVVLPVQMEHPTLPDVPSVLDQTQSVV